jgi:hypothetical protein
MRRLVEIEADALPDQMERDVIGAGDVDPIATCARSRRRTRR